MLTPGQPSQLSQPRVLVPRGGHLPLTAPARWLRLTGWLAGLRHWESSLALLLITVVYSTIQGATENIIGVDGYYHVKVAVLMREQGWRLLAPLDFPWLQLTILGPGRYTDHHFLFHLLQVPFTFGDPRIGARMAAVLFAVLGLYTTYVFLARFRVRYAALWVALVIACAPAFLWRQSMARTQSLSLLLIVLGLWALFAGRLYWLLVVGFLAAWLFNGFFFVLGGSGAAVVVAIGAALVTRFQPRGGAVSDGELTADDSAAPSRTPQLPSLRFTLTAVGWTAAGLGLGLLLHPYFPRNVEFAFFHLLPKAVPAEQAGVSVGQEWAPYSLRGFVTRAGPSTALVAIGLLPVGITLWRRQRPDWRVLVMAILAVGFLGMVARSQRIIEYFPAFAAMFCGWSLSYSPVAAAWFSDLARARLPARVLNAGSWLRPVAPWLAALLLAPAIVTSTLIAAKSADDGLDWDTYRDGALWLAAHSPAGSRVFTTGWDDFPHMFYWNTHNTYLVGLDPTYMSLEDPEAYRLWRSISEGRTRNPSQLIRERFESPYVLTDLAHARFIDVAAGDPGLQEVFRNKTVVVYRVRGG